MGWSSWFKRTKQQPNNINNSIQEQQLYGITDQLINHVKSFTIETFKSFPLQDEEEGSCGASTSANVQMDLSEWQEHHALLILSKVKELAQIRFKLCPGRLKEREFWRIYFTLVWNDVAEYELEAIRQSKLKKMASGNEESSNSNGFEVEMAETKQMTASSEPLTP